MVYGHLDDPEGQEIKRGVSYLNLRPGGVGGSAWWAAAVGWRQRGRGGLLVAKTAPPQGSLLPSCAPYN